MKPDLYNFIRGDFMTSEIAVIDNIARELQDLNRTMENILTVLQAIFMKNNFEKENKNDA